MVIGHIECTLKVKKIRNGTVFKFTTLQGGMVSKAEIEQAKQDIDIRTFRQEFEGTFENYAGAVYYNFHAVENIKRKKDRLEQTFTYWFRL